VVLYSAAPISLGLQGIIVGYVFSKNFGSVFLERPTNSKQTM